MLFRSNTCEAPCIPEQASWYYSCSEGNEGEEKALNCTCPFSFSSYYDITVSFDGCGLYPISPCEDTTCGKCLTFKVVGKGTITIDPDITVTCTEGNTRTIGMRVNGETSLEVVDCDEITITPYYDCNKCCSCCGFPFTKTVLAEYCGGSTCDFCSNITPNFRKYLLAKSLKRSIFSRIKKVHYKP